MGRQPTKPPAPGVVTTHWLRAIIAPAAIGSCAALVLLANATVASVGRSRWFANRTSRSRRPLNQQDVCGGDQQTIAGLRNAIVGAGEREIVSVFGPPQSAAAGDAGHVWYYSLRQREKLAMAISFEQGLAREVEFFHPPM